MKAQFRFLSGARTGQVESFRKAYIGLGRHPLSDVRFDTERDLDVSSRHAAIVRKGDAFVLQDLNSRNGTYLNGKRIEGEVALADGDVIGFGASGPSVEFRALAAAEAEAPAPPPRRSSTAVRIAIEVARQTQSLRRTTKILLVALVLTAAGFAGIQWKGSRDRAREIAELQARAESLSHEAQELIARFRSELKVLRDALAESQAETARLRSDLAAAGGDEAAIARLRAALDAAERRQRGLIGATGVDYRTIARKNQDAVAIVVVEFSDTERFSGTAFAVDSQGTLVTNRHVLTGEAGDRQPQRIAVKFSGSRQWFQAQLAGAAPAADVAVLKVDIRGGTPRVAGIAREPRAVERGDPVAVIGYPLGLDLPMEGQGLYAAAEPTLTVGTVSKVLTDVIQVDGFGAPGSSGSPVFDRDGNVIGVLYGGVREAQGKIVYAIPAKFVREYLGALRIPVR